MHPFAAMDMQAADHSTNPGCSAQRADEPCHVKRNKHNTIQSENMPVASGRDTVMLRLGIDAMGDDSSGPKVVCPS